jgi:hypothetical protein
MELHYQAPPAAIIVAVIVRSVLRGSVAGAAALTKGLTPDPVLDSITCPGCGEVIPISETIYRQVAERAERELKAKSVRQERALAEREKQLQAREDEFDQRVQERSTP